LVLRFFACLLLAFLTSLNFTHAFENTREGLAPVSSSTRLAADDPGVINGSFGSQSDIDYRLLAPIGGLEEVQGRSALEQYLTVVFNIVIGMAVVFAIVMIVIGGMQYMMTDSFTSKGAARKTVTNAILGLLLALGSFVILQLIGGTGTFTDLRIVMRGIEHAPPPPPPITTDPPAPIYSVEGCTDEATVWPTQEDREYFCSGGNEYDIISKLNLRIVTGDEGSRPVCQYITQQEVAEEFASRCLASGGIIYDSAPTTHFCLSQNPDCDPSELHFPSLAGLTDLEWDELFCDTRQLDSLVASGDITTEQRTDLLNLYSDMSSATGASIQTSGYYNDAEYYDALTLYHAGIDMRAHDENYLLKSPVRGTVRIMRDLTSGCYVDNDKVAVVEEGTGITWVFTHVQVDNYRHLNGVTVNTGSVIATGSSNPGYSLSGGGCGYFAPHLHLETLYNSDCVYETNNSLNWSTTGGCVNSGFVSDAQGGIAVIQAYSMCPLQTYWELINGQ
jgi:hypothetical protein